MKLCFSTVGCPDWSFDDILSTAKDLGLQGAEIRGISDVLYAPDIPVFRPENIEKTMKKLENTGLTLPVIDSNAGLGEAGRGEAAFKEAKAYIDLAAALKAPYVRVMSTRYPDPEDCDLDIAVNLYRELCEYGQALGVLPLMETNAVLADSGKMKKFMADVNHKNAGVLWDIHHPYRFYGEAPETTVGNLGNLIKHVHIKDSVSESGKVVYKMLGYGDVPVKESLALLKTNGYDGFVSFEWVKRWNKDLQEPGIVFAHFANYMSGI